MATISPDTRSEERKRQDEAIASEPPLPPLDLPEGAQPFPMEEHLRKRHRKPQAFLGVVENGVVRPVDPDVRLPDRSSVIIVTAGGP
jgi:hypothetical protein